MMRCIRSFFLVLIPSVLIWLSMATCGNDMVVRYQGGAKSNMTPCTNWRGVNICNPNQNLKPIRDHWLSSDLRLPPLRPENLPEPGSPAAQLMVKHCSACHNLPSPAMHAASDWKPILARMKVRSSQALQRGILNMSQIPNAQDHKRLKEYLTRFALRAIGEHKLKAKDSKGALAFRATCARCHALPHPKQHLENRWAPVVERMFKYSKQSGIKSGNESTKIAIIEYLKKYSRH